MEGQAEVKRLRQHYYMGKGDSMNIPDHDQDQDISNQDHTTRLPCAFCLPHPLSLSVARMTPTPLSPSSSFLLSSRSPVSSHSFVSPHCFGPVSLSACVCVCVCVFRCVSPSLPLCLYTVSSRSSHSLLSLFLSKDWACQCCCSASRESSKGEGPTVTKGGAA